MTSRHMSDGASMRTRERRDMTYRVVGDGEQLIHRLLQRLHDRRRPRRLNRSSVSENPPRSVLSPLARVRSIQQPLPHLHDGRRIRQRLLRRAHKPVDGFFLTRIGRHVTGGGHAVRVVNEHTSPARLVGKTP